MAHSLISSTLDTRSRDSTAYESFLIPCAEAWCTDSMMMIPQGSKRVGVLWGTERVTADFVCN
jgi:hypothetical protein